MDITYSAETMDKLQRQWDGNSSMEHTLIDTERRYYDEFDTEFHSNMLRRYEINKIEKEWKCVWRKCSDDFKEIVGIQSIAAFLVHPFGYIIRASSIPGSQPDIMAYCIVSRLADKTCTATSRDLECFHPRYIKILEARKTACLVQASNNVLAAEYMRLELITYMNRYFAHVEDTQTVYVKVVQDQEVKIITYSLKDFRNSYPSADVSKIVDSKTETHACSYWLKHEHHIWYDTSTIAIKTRPRVLNLFSGLIATKEELEDLDEDEALPLLEHIYFVWCKGNEVKFHYTLRWLAHLVRKPCTKMKVALVLQAVEGAGKGIIVEKFKEIFGRHFKSLGMESITGQFNGQLLDCLLLFLDESLYSGDKAVVGKLKRLITESTHQINEKFVRNITVENQLNMIVATNNMWAVPVERTDRRYFILDCSDAHASGSVEDAAYFDRLAAVSSRTLLKLLFSIDISNFNPTIMPMTQAKRIQKEIGLNSVELWWLDMLREEATILFNMEEDTSRIICKKDIYQLFAAWHRQNASERFMEPYTRFWMIMKQMTHCEDVRSGGKTTQLYCAKLPILSLAKSYFCRYVKDPTFLDENKEE